MTFTSHLGRTNQSGFTSNQRPVIFYGPSLDLIDNPQFGLLLFDNFTSETKQQYQPPNHSNGSRHLPRIHNKPSVSGFHHVSFSETEPVDKKSEYQRLFVPHRLTHSGSNYMQMGQKEETGFTQGANLQLNTFKDKNSCTVEPRQTFSSVMKNDFLPPSSLQVSDSMQGVHSQESGYTRGAIAPLAIPSSLLPSPETGSNISVVKTIGKNELTGFIRNTPNEFLPKGPNSTSHFTTHYQSKFCHGYQKDRNSVSASGIISKTQTVDSSYNHRDTDMFN
uniref:Stabilizer of axonemal microtubules 4 n=1 Tax=Fundulus heteroclitus TaxID=8078 RepID=A0A3Q2Q9J4_FUNHE